MRNNNNKKKKKKKKKNHHLGFVLQIWCTKINIGGPCPSSSPHPSECLTMNGCYSAEVDELPRPDSSQQS